jgi:Lipid A 3-O-deacylase (PagL)
MLLAFEQLAAAQESGISKHDWDFGVWSSVATGEENTNSFAEAQIWTVGGSFGKTFFRGTGRGWRKGNLEYAFSLSPLFVQLRPQTLHGIAFQPLIFRWNSNLHASRVTPYIELAGGGVHTNENLPAGNTSNFNFTAQGGGGIYLPFGRTSAFDAGVRWSHISNANLGVRNPEFNGIELGVGYHWFH